ncbi:MAG: hypothetical protein M0002_08255 [Rhodospirillales bacterium]|nr:hypothetical protein [Rhodospirillales bacterium]
MQPRPGFCRYYEVRALLALSGALLLAACAASATSPVVTLANAQAEADAILAALEAGATVYTSAATTTPSEATAAENVIAVAKASVAAFEAPGSAASVALLAETVSQDIAAVLAVMPIDPATKTAIDVGMTIIDALIAGHAGLAGQPSAPALTLRLGPEVAPVPIPAPHVLPVGP